MKVVAFSKTGAKKEAQVTLSKDVFGNEANHQLVQLAYDAYLANGRSSGASVLTRGMVRGGGKKPWKQKGTGKARAGSTRLPHWRGGGVAFGPTGLENHAIELPVKQKRAAIRQALSLQAGDKKIAIIEEFAPAEPTVKAALKVLDKLKLEGRIVLAVSDKTDAIDRATRNLADIQVVQARYLNVFTILNADHIVLTQAAHDEIVSWLGDAK